MGIFLNFINPNKLSVGSSSWQLRHSPTLVCSFHRPCLHGSTTSYIRVLIEPLRSARSNHHTRSRRSADYQPNRWNYDLLESLSTHDFKGEYDEKREKMIAEVKEMLQYSAMDTLRQLELVDAIDRLGLKRHFKEEIKACVELIYGDDMNIYDAGDLSATTLRFRVLRQHGYAISEDIFNKFKDQHGNIRQEFTEDIRGLLGLYEASFLECMGDATLEEIRAFATRHLKLQLTTLKPRWAKVVQQALDLPLHWRFPRLKARWFIDEAYEHQNFHPSLVYLAKLDYNIVQTCYKNEIKQVVRWWKDLELPMKLTYTRDRLMEHYLWTVGLVEEPEYHQYRVMETKVFTLITALDDTYDVYGTLEELEIFTDLITRWEINGIDQLPKPMRHCFLAIHNTSNEIADWALNKKDFHIISYLRKAWARLCKNYLQEAKWYYDGYKPTLREYLDNGMVTTSAHLMLLYCYFLTTPFISMEAVDHINKLPSLLCCAASVTRLSNDLATSEDELARGDTLKALECYMNESGASKEVAREHINGLIEENWKKLNQEYYFLCHAQYPPTISEPFLGANLNLARSSLFFYSFKKDWHGKPDQEMMDHMSLLLLNPIPMDGKI